MSCFKRISFLFLVQKKRLEVNVGEIWELCVNLFSPAENFNLSLTLALPIEIRSS